MKNLKKIIVAASLCAAIGATAIAGTLAYFTDTDEATNVFTAGDLGIDLTEADWDPEAAHQIIPGASFDKTPVITFDKDSVASYVRVVVTMPEALYKYSNLNITPEEQYGEYVTFVGAQKPTTATVANGIATLHYDFTENAATAGTEITTLFTDVSFSYSLSNDEDLVSNPEDYTAWTEISAVEDLKIGIKVYAIQQDAATNIDDAMDIF